MKLISNWRDSWRMTSVNLPALGLALLAVLDAAPDALTSVWLSLPPDLKTYIPPDFGKWIGFLMIGLGVASRLVIQPALARRRKELEAERPPGRA
ncbi:hypothetical protein [Alcaligenes sp. WGS1538]|uniref:DUF7940 domain-containing protein n=1 Tax=Alcaligenes sp. WGS1538 TaxID=3366811 RepID=UPI00372D5D8C